LLVSACEEFINENKAVLRQELAMPSEPGKQRFPVALRKEVLPLVVAPVRIQTVKFGRVSVKENERLKPMLKNILRRSMGDVAFAVVLCSDKVGASDGNFS
jgi:hypothetical protein